MFAEKMDLRLPGPVQVPREIQRAMLRSFDHPMMDYRNVPSDLHRPWCMANETRTVRKALIKLPVKDIL